MTGPPTKQNKTSMRHLMLFKGFSIEKVFAGAALLVLFVILNFIVMSLCYSKTLKNSHLIFAVAANVSPTLAALSATGLVLLVGFHINMLILISPFLTLAIGIGKLVYAVLSFAFETFP